MSTSKEDTGRQAVVTQPGDRMTAPMEDTRGHGVVTQPGEGIKYWQPLPANGFSEAMLPMKAIHYQGFSMGYQTIANGGRVRRHSHPAQVELQICFRGKGSVYVNGETHSLQSGTSCFLGLDVEHEIFADKGEDLTMLWVISPGGLENFFEQIGRQVRAGEATPKPFDRPKDVLEIERSLGTEAS